MYHIIVSATEEKIPMRRISSVIIALLLITASVQAQEVWFNPDTVTADRFDTGRMWTFEYPPTDYFTETYNFTPTEQWYEHVRMSALKFATYCSASFVSEDGLVMTNHHCGAQAVTQVTREGEDLTTNGFYAATLEEERQVPGLFVDQLALIEDVTDRVQAAVDMGTSDEEKLANLESIMDEIADEYAESTGLETQVVSLYNGGKYSLYGFKRYSDVRLVMSPESALGFFGGDPDNFTYPRYNLDFNFFRVYDADGNPLKTTHYLKWSKNGPELGEPVFVVGNPASTSRLLTVSQLEYLRDVSYPPTLTMLEQMGDVIQERMESNPGSFAQLNNMYLMIANSRKAYSGMLMGLRDPYLMAKKRAFEQEFKEAVLSDKELKEKYGDIWSQIEQINVERREIGPKAAAYSLNQFSPYYFQIAEKLIEYARQMQLPEEERKSKYKGEKLEKTKKNLYPPQFSKTENNQLIPVFVNSTATALGMDNKLVVQFTGGSIDDELVEDVLEKAVVDEQSETMALVEKGPEAILNSDDPFIYFLVNTQDELPVLQAKMQELNTRQDALVEQLGRAIYDVYGTSIPPDATFTLRITDGVLSGFDYNGTIAPPVTTYYGLYDRFYSHQQEYPWALPELWQNPPAEFDLNTPMNFISTNDITGGNSGSPVINQNAEVVGLAFDGNYQGLPGFFIFDELENRCVNVHSEGIIEAVRDVYQYQRLSDELLNGKLPQ